jgi:hypothetical protein
MRRRLLASVGSPPLGSQAEARPKPQPSFTPARRRYATPDLASLLPLGAALLVVVLVWVPLFALRVRARQPNVDDYEYAQLAYAFLYYSLGGIVSHALHSGATSPLVPLLASPLARTWGVNGAVAVQLPLLLLLVGGAYSLARMWLGARSAALTATAVGLNQAVLGWAIMLNFSVAVTAALLWSFAAYFRSDRLRTWRWSLVFGVAVASLLLSRSVAPVYAVPLAAVLAADQVVLLLRRRSWPGLPALSAIGLVLVLAGPWWLVSGRTAAHYLTSAGYEVSSGYTSQGGALTLATMHNRLVYSLAELGWPQSLVLAAALACACALALRRPRRPPGALALMAAWAVLTFLVLSTSSNVGTGFALPVLGVAVVVLGACLGSMPRKLLPVAGAAVLAAVAVGIAAEATGAESRWWPGPPYYSEALQAGATPRTDIAALTADVARTTGDGPTMVLRDDDLFNVNGLAWSIHSDQLRLVQVPTGTGSTSAALSGLARTSFLVTGLTRAAYYPYIDQQRVELAAEADGFRPLRMWRVSSSNDVVVWRRGLPAPQTALVAPPPATHLLAPSPGSVLHGSVFLNAGVVDQPFGVSKVEFRVSGGILRDAVVSKGVHFQYGWLGAWDTRGVPNGAYTLQSVAYDSLGDSGRSASAVVQVQN